MEARAEEVAVDPPVVAWEKPFRAFLVVVGVAAVGVAVGVELRSGGAPGFGVLQILLAGAGGVALLNGLAGREPGGLLAWLDVPAAQRRGMITQTTIAVFLILAVSYLTGQGLLRVLLQLWVPRLLLWLRERLRCLRMLLHLLRQLRLRRIRLRQPGR